MIINNTKIEGLFELKVDVRGDNRGFFLKPFSNEELRGKVRFGNVAEIIYSQSQKDVIRGMHFQIPPFAQNKLVWVVSGAILDVVLDLRKKSRTFGKYYFFKLSANDGNVLYISNGLAHGFLALEDETIVMYALDERYSKDHEAGIKYDSFGFAWPVEDPVLSDRDKSFVRFDDYSSPFW